MAFKILGRCKFLAVSGVPGRYFLSKDSFKPNSIQTTALIHLGEDDGPKITRIDLDCEAEVPGLDSAKFAEYAKTAREKCPISRFFVGTENDLSAKLIG